MNRLTRHQNNLDAEYEAMLDHQGALDIEREAHEERLLWELKQTDPLIREYISAVVGLTDFLQWAWKKHMDELTPAYKQGWEREVD